MIILIPFYLLKLRDELKKNRSQKNINALKLLIKDDIMSCIELNVKLANISFEDGVTLRDMMHQLYMHLYADYEELEEITTMFDHSLELPHDSYVEKMLLLKKNLLRWKQIWHRKNPPWMKQLLLWLKRLASR